jgi:hypothetical protein
MPAGFEGGREPQGIELQPDAAKERGNGHSAKVRSLGFFEGELRIFVFQASKPGGKVANKW